MPQRFLTLDTFGGRYEDPLSLHKYLYVADNPVNRIDPSGHDGSVLTTSISLSTALIISAIALPTLTEATLTIKNHTTGNSLDQIQQVKLTQARQYITQNQALTPASVQPYSIIAVNASIRVHDTLRARGSGAWGATQLYGQWAGNVIHLERGSFLLDKRLLASLLVHEAVHVRQWIPTESSSEPEAYQIQSDELRAWGLTANSIGDARILFPVTDQIDIVLFPELAS